MSQQPQRPKKVIHLPQVRMLGRARPSNIKINVKPAKPDPEMLKKLEEEKLREQVKKEIEERSKTCKHKNYECPLPVLTDREYCVRHILTDPKAPYKQCAHGYGNGERCHMPAPLGQAGDRRDLGLCFEHARTSLLSRQRSAAPPPPVITPESLLDRLNHYVKTDRVRTTSCTSSVSVVSDPADQDHSISIAADPFKQINAVEVNKAISASILECCSETDSDGEECTVGRNGLSRTVDTRVDSCMPTQFGVLSKAGIYTAEEAVAETRNAYKALRTAYIRQMGRLKCLLQSARMKYVRTLRAERDMYCSINTQARSAPLTTRERKQLKKLKAYASFHRKHGVDAVLARKLHKKRAKVNDPLPNRYIPSQTRCVFAEGGVRCKNNNVPASKHCLKHILEDRQQVLFSMCEDARGGVPCREPVVKLPYVTACRYHTVPPPHMPFSLKKECGSGSETNTASDISQSDLEDYANEDRDFIHSARVFQKNALFLTNSSTVTHTGTPVTSDGVAGETPSPQLAL